MKIEETQQKESNKELEEKKKSIKTTDDSLKEKKSKKSTIQKKQTKKVSKENDNKNVDTKTSKRKTSSTKKPSSSKKKSESKTIEKKVADSHIDKISQKQIVKNTKKKTTNAPLVNKASNVNYFSKANIIKRKLNGFSRDIKLRYRIFKTKLESKKVIRESNRRYKQYYKDSIRFGKSVKSTIGKTSPIVLTNKVETKAPAPVVKPDVKTKKTVKKQAEKQKQIKEHKSLHLPKIHVDKQKGLNAFKKIIIVALSGYLLFSAVKYFPLLINYVQSLNNKKEDIVIEEKQEEEEVVEIKDYADDKYRSIFIESYEKAYNKDDFIGQIIFDSEIINEPVVQGKDNDYYLRRNYETLEYEIAGPIFVDCDCNVYIDNNTILYGHDFPKEDDPEQKLFFTPLHLLTDEDNYEDNKTICFVLRDRVETYLVCYVYDIAITQSVEGDQYLVEGEPIYYNNNYSEEELEEYISAVEERKMYDTNNTINYGDKLLTLQTCYEDRIDKLIVLAKLVDTKYFENSIK